MPRVTTFHALSTGSSHPSRPSANSGAFLGPVPASLTTTQRTAVAFAFSATNSESATQTFQVTVISNTVNSGAFLGPVPASLTTDRKSTRRNSSTVSESL